MPLTPQEELELLELEEEEYQASQNKQPQFSTPEKAAKFKKAMSVPETVSEEGVTGAEAYTLGGTLGFGDELGSAIANPKGALEQTLSYVGGSDASSTEAEQYRKDRDFIRQQEQKAASEQPELYYGSQVLTSAMPVAGAAKAAGTAQLVKEAVKRGLLGGAALGAGASEAETGDLGKLASDTAVGAALGGAMGGGVSAGIRGAGSLIKGVGSKAASVAESLAEKATGATGREAERFAPGAGRQLLDRGIVKFGSSPDDIAKAAESQIAKAEKAKTGILTSLDSQGGAEAVSKLDVGDAIERKIIELRKDPGNGPIIRQLEKRLEDVREGQDIMSLTEADAIKRNFGRRGYRNPDPDVNAAEKQMEEIYRNMVESRAEGISPQLASEFKGAKNIQSLLIPVENAAERRASTLNQSPLLGARDALGGAVGGAVGSTIGGPIGGLAGAAVGAGVNRIVSPRLPAAGAVIADRLGKALTKTGQTLEKAGIPSKAADKIGKSQYADYLLRDPSKTMINHFILTQQDKAYRMLVEDENE